MTCKQITEVATDYTEGHLRPLERLRFRVHLALCRHCRSYLRQLDITARALRALPEPGISPELADALLNRFDAWAAGRKASTSTTSRGGRARTASPVLAVIAAFGLILGLASSRSSSAEDWALALALAAAAPGLAALSGRFSFGVIAAAVLAALAAALARGGEGPLVLSNGVHCLLAEIASAAAVAGAVWLARRPGRPARARHDLVAAAAAGALAADAALHVTCGAAGSLPHLLVFHVGGVVAAAAGAMLFLRAWLRPAHS
jgi:predicted anti-sigma-YlaC factor YlaD